jgi:hypothetical protein
MVCLGNICINTLHEGVNNDDDDDDDNNNNDDDDNDNNNNFKVSHMFTGTCTSQSNMD